MKTPKHILEIQHQYYVRNREKILKKRADRYRNDEKFRERIKERYQRDKEKIHQAYLVNKQNPEYLKRRAEIHHRYYLKKKERRNARAKNQI